MEVIYIYLYKRQKDYSFIINEAQKLFEKSNLKIDFDEYGKPWFNDKDLYLSKSDSDELLVFGLSKIPFGIDIEKYKIYNQRICDKYFSEEEKLYMSMSENTTISFLEIWTRKEAYMKFDGRGLRILPYIDTMNNGLSNCFKSIFGKDYIISIFSKSNFNYVIKTKI